MLRHAISLLEGRWAPCLALVLGSIAFVLSAVALIPNQLGNPPARERPVADVVSIPVAPAAAAPRPLSAPRSGLLPAGLPPAPRVVAAAPALQPLDATLHAAVDVPAEAAPAAPETSNLVPSPVSEFVTGEPTSPEGRRGAEKVLLRHLERRRRAQGTLNRGPRDGTLQVAAPDTAAPGTGSPAATAAIAEPNGAPAP